MRGKPDPDLYLLAAAKLGVAPEACLVFEDADMGIHAADAAGMVLLKFLRAEAGSFDGSAFSGQLGGRRGGLDQFSYFPLT